MLVFNDLLEQFDYLVIWHPPILIRQCPKRVCPGTSGGTKATCGKSFSSCNFGRELTQFDSSRLGISHLLAGGPYRWGHLSWKCRSTVTTLSLSHFRHCVAAGLTSSSSWCDPLICWHNQMKNIYAEPTNSLSSLSIIAFLQCFD